MAASILIQHFLKHRAVKLRWTDSEPLKITQNHFKILNVLQSIDCTNKSSNIYIFKMDMISPTRIAFNQAMTRQITTPNANLHPITKSIAISIARIDYEIAKYQTPFLQRRMALWIINYQQSNLQKRAEKSDPHRTALPNAKPHPTPK